MSILAVIVQGAAYGALLGFCIAFTSFITLSLLAGRSLPEDRYDAMERMLMWMRRGFIFGGALIGSILALWTR